MQKKTHTWVATFIWLLIFFPVGLYLAYSKMKYEPKNILKNGKMLRILGIVSIVYAPLYVCIVYDSTSTIGMLLFMFAAYIVMGILMIIKSGSYIKLGARLEKYPPIIATTADLYIGNIAALVNTDENTALEDLKNIISLGIVEGYHIDYNNKILVKDFAEESGTDKGENPIVVKCPHCGATNSIVPGQKAVCEYCDSPLKLE